MKTKILNFTKADEIEVSAGIHEQCGPLVTLIQQQGSLGFQFDMRPEQAREMAEALLAAAESLDPTLLEVAA